MICHKKFWTYWKHKPIFGLAQKNLNLTKTFWDLHRRTRRQYVVTQYFTEIHFHAVQKFASICVTCIYIHMWVYAGQFGLSCFYKKNTKLARFMAKTLHRVLLFCEYVDDWADIPNTPLWCGGGSRPWPTWAQTISMASCLISNPGNSANTDSIHQAILPLNK